MELSYLASSQILIVGIWVAVPFAHQIQAFLPFVPEYVRMTTLVVAILLPVWSLLAYGLRGLFKSLVGVAFGLAVYEALGLLYFFYWNGFAEGIEPIYLTPVYPAVSLLGYLAWNRLWIALALVPIWVYVCKPKPTQKTLLLVIFLAAALAGWFASGFHANHYWLVLSGRELFNPLGEFFNVLSKTLMLLITSWFAPFQIRSRLKP